MGCEPVIIEPRTPVTKLKDLQGLVLIGGPDIPPEFYGGRYHRTIHPQAADKVQHDFKLIHYSAHIRLPILGICAGMQTLGCYYGSSLFQHIPESGTKIKHQTAHGRHKLVGMSDRFKRILGPNVLVNSRHHQCVGTGGGLQVEAFSPDGFIEAVSHRDLPIVGVQWHPEDLVEETPFRNLFHWFKTGFKEC